MESNDQGLNGVPQPVADPNAQTGQKPKKPLYKKWWFWVIVVLLVSMVYGAVSGGPSDDGSSSADGDAKPAQVQEDGVEATPPVDKGALKTSLDSAAAFEASTYTAESYGVLEEAVSQAEEVLASDEATQLEVDTAVRGIESAIAGLKEEFKPENYSSAAYTDVARNPDSYMGERLVFSGKVLQVVEGAKENNLRIATDGAYDDVIFVGYDPSIMSSRVLEDDMVTVYGTCIGLYSYTTVMGAKVSLPGLYVDHIEFQ